MNSSPVGLHESQFEEARRKRASRTLIVVAALFVIVPYLFWRGTWFGRKLTDAELGEYLTDTTKPRHNQHALVQVGERIERGDASVNRWYPQVLSLAASPHPEIRVILAWILGEDNRSEDFHRALLNLARDPEPLVRRNAALSLVRFGDAGGRRELLNMLQPFTVTASGGGVLRYRLKGGDSVDSGTTVAKVETPGQEPVEIRSPVPGKIETILAPEGATVAAGQPIVVLSPGADHVREALRALYYVGTADDLADVERVSSGGIPGIDSTIQQQAAATADAIRKRIAQNGITSEPRPSEPRRNIPARRGP